MRAAHDRRASRGIVAGFVTAFLAGLGIVPLTLAAPSAEAAIPVPGADEAVVQMYVGDLRTGDSQIGPLPDAIFGLFALPPDAEINHDDGYVYVNDLPAGTVLFQCRSDADGDCVFTIPIREGDPVACEDTPTDPRASWPVTCQAGAGVSQGTRLWAAAITYDPENDGFDYYANPWWQTAPLSNTDHMSIRHVFQTPALVGGRTYRAGTDWITPAGAFTTPRTPADPAQPANPNAATQRDLARRVASGGVTPLSRFNVDFPQQCGMNVGMAVDVSSSIGNSGAQGQLVDVMDSFVDALRGTPSSVALLTFGTDSPANGFNPNTGLQSVATATDADVVKAQYESWRTRAPWPTNYTNWDRGLAAAAALNAPVGSAGHLDLVLFITDGNPTVYGANPLNASGQPRDANSGYTRFRELGNGLASANLVKSQGTRVLAFGVGSGMGDAHTAYNLRTISGRDEYASDPDGPYQTSNLLEADYVQTTDWTTAAAAMRSLVLEACAPSISVVKRIVPNGGTVDDAVLPTTQWGFQATTSSPDVTLTPTTPPYALTDLGSGGVSFDISFDDPAQAPASIRVEEDAASQPEYTPMPEETVCVERSTGTDIPLSTAPDGSTAFSVDVDLEQMVTCVVYNRAPPDVIPASVVVHKQWRVITATGIADYPNGRQPAGLAAQLTLTGPDSTDATAQPWSVERAGYDAASPDDERNSTTIDETLNISNDMPLCTASESPQIKPGAPDSTSGYAPLPDGGLDSGPLPAGVSEWTILNEITCESRLTLAKTVTNGPLATPEGEALWELTGYGPAGTPGIPAEITGHSGDASVTSVPVVPDAVYQLAEAIPDPSPDHYMYHYRQADVRADPILYPQSSGSWDCRPDGNPSGDPSLGAEGAVVVPLGQAFTCVAVNSTALLTVDKTVDGVPAANPEDWQFLVTANDPIIIPDPQEHQFPASVEQSLVPGQSYRLTEVEVPEGYELESLTCTTGGEPIPDLTAFALLVGATATCTANNTAIPPGTFTVTKALTGSAADDPALDGVEFTVEWSADTDPVQSGTITLTPGQTDGPGLDLPEGTVVTLGELTPTMPTSPPITWAGATWTGDGVTTLPDGRAQLTIERSTTIAATVTNTVLEPGQFTVQKLVSGNAATDPALDTATFTFEYTVDGQPGASSPFTLAPGAIFTSEELADGTEVVVTETAVDLPPGYIQDGLTWSGGNPQGDDAVSFGIPTDTSIAATATNEISQPAWFQVTKTLTGTAATNPAFTSNPPDCTTGIPFTIDWEVTGGPSAGESGTLTLRGAAGCDVSAAIPLLPGTEVTLSEQDPAGHESWPEQVTWTGVSWVPGATITLGKSGITAHVSAENTVTAPGSFQVTKTITGASGNPLIAGLCFDIDWTSTSGQAGTLVVTAETPSPEITLLAGSEVTLHENGITTTAPGCETALPDGFTWDGVTWDGPGVTTTGGDASFTIDSTTTAAITAANQITAPGGFTLEKLLQGTGAEHVLEADTTFDVAYTINGGTPTTITLTPGTVEGPIVLPAGTTVGLEELPASLPDDVTLDGISWTIDGIPTDPAEFTVTTDTEVAAVVTNTVTSTAADPGFAVRKQFTGDAADTVGLADAEFTVNWSADTDPTQSGTFTITGAGISGTVNLLAGTTVTLTEATPTTLPDDVDWAGHRFVAGPGIAVSADGHAATITIPGADAEAPIIEITLVNEFSTTPTPSPSPTSDPSPPTPSPLPSTGAELFAPLIALALGAVLLGTMLILASRRRAREN